MIIGYTTLSLEVTSPVRLALLRLWFFALFRFRLLFFIFFLAHLINLWDCAGSTPVGRQHYIQTTTRNFVCSFEGLPSFGTRQRETHKGRQSIVTSRIPPSQPNSILHRCDERFSGDRPIFSSACLATSDSLVPSGTTASKSERAIGR